MSQRTPVALIQMRSGVDAQANADAVEAFVRKAANQGATLIATPEATNIVQRDPNALRAAVTQPSEDPVYQRCDALARELKVWLLAGSLMVRAEDGGVANRSYLFAPDGRRPAAYDKIHLFDVTLAAGETYAESATVRPGSQAVVTASPLGPMGLSICYDVRFPHLYRALAHAGARVITAPAAFTRHTGRAHWELLVRARAVEAQAFVLAPAQGGLHEDGRSTWGRSLVVDPWGAVVAHFDHDEPGVLMARLDLGQVDHVRAKLPSLRHDRAFHVREDTDAAPPRVEPAQPS